MELFYEDQEQSLRSYRARRAAPARHQKHKARDKTSRRDHDSQGATRENNNGATATE